jgi:UDP-N-acetylglucosamine 4,6-dehydratase
MFNNKSVLITGGTGSFGNKCVENLLLNYRCKRIIIFSRDELKQYEMSQKFSTIKYPNIRYFIGDVRDYNRLIIAFREVDYVIHAAALKQVPAAEYNPLEYIKTNIEGAENIIRAAIECQVKKVIALSTDKAANPINLYGATKLVSDKLFVSANNIVGNQNISFSIVRYGNVFGSRGSIIPHFLDLIKKKSKYLFITDKEMTRFWITLDQGVKFVLYSMKEMSGGEIFVPKLPSIKIVDIVRAMSATAKIKYIGIRPGEKLHEVMCPIDESHLTVEFKKYFVIKPTISFDDRSSKFHKNKMGEKGKLVPKNFEYNSKNNNVFLKIKDIQNFLKNYNEDSHK